jgi:hypothetical protein
MYKIKDSCGDLHLFDSFLYDMKITGGNGELVIVILDEAGEPKAAFRNPIYFLEE